MFLLGLNVHLRTNLHDTLIPVHLLPDVEFTLDVIFLSTPVTVQTAVLAGVVGAETVLAGEIRVGKLLFPQCFFDFSVMSFDVLHSLNSAKRFL